MSFQKIIGFQHAVALADRQLPADHRDHEDEEQREGQVGEEEERARRHHLAYLLLPAQLRRHLGALARELVKEAEEASAGGDGMRCEVKEMSPDKSYVRFTFERLRDVRIVYTPPMALGNFGGDTDNFEWPRHVADFTLLRAYVGPDGAAAEQTGVMYSADFRFGRKIEKKREIFFRKIKIIFSGTEICSLDFFEENLQMICDILYFLQKDLDN